jgi:hypothetical protein
MRGFKKDSLATSICKEAGRALREDGREPFWYPLDRRSFLSQPKIIVGECETPEHHIIAYGKDKGPIRAEIFRRNREGNGGVNRCWKCNRFVREDLMDSYGGALSRGEWDHIRNKDGERCDDPENGRVACRQCHFERHPQVQFTRTPSI